MTATLSMADAAIALVLVHCRITSLVRGYEATESPASAKNTCGPRSEQLFISEGGAENVHAH